MSRTLLILCVLGLMVAVVCAHSMGGHRGGQGEGRNEGHGEGRGGHGHGGRGRGRGRGQGRGGNLRELTCEVTVNGTTTTTECKDGDCTLGPLTYTDDEGREVRTVMFCDALYAAETSKVVSTSSLHSVPLYTC